MDKTKASAAVHAAVEEYYGSGSGYQKYSVYQDFEQALVAVLEEYSEEELSRIVSEKERVNLASEAVRRAHLDVAAALFWASADETGEEVDYDSHDLRSKITDDLGEIEDLILEFLAKN